MTVTQDGRESAAASAFLEGETVPVLRTAIETTNAEFAQNGGVMRQRMEALQRALDRVRQGGGKALVDRHRERGKLTARERIDGLLDPGTPFLEVSPLAAWEMYGGDAPSAGIVTGVGRVAGHEVMIVVNDATVKGGTYYPITVKKHLRAQEIAEQNRLPCTASSTAGGPSACSSKSSANEPAGRGCYGSYAAMTSDRNASSNEPPAVRARLTIGKIRLA